VPINSRSASYCPAIASRICGACLGRPTDVGCRTRGAGRPSGHATERTVMRVALIRCEGRLTAAKDAVGHSGTHGAGRKAANLAASRAGVVAVTISTVSGHFLAQWVPWPSKPSIWARMRRLLHAWRASRRLCERRRRSMRAQHKGCTHILAPRGSPPPSLGDVRRGGSIAAGLGFAQRLPWGAGNPPENGRRCLGLASRSRQRMSDPRNLRE
jgi:hypothetical protein